LAPGPGDAAQALPELRLPEPAGHGRRRVRHLHELLYPFPGSAHRLFPAGAGPELPDPDEPEIRGDRRIPDPGWGVREGDQPAPRRPRRPGSIETAARR